MYCNYYYEYGVPPAWIAMNCSQGMLLSQKYTFIQLISIVQLFCMYCHNVMVVTPLSSGETQIQARKVFMLSAIESLLNNRAVNSASTTKYIAISLYSVCQINICNKTPVYQLIDFPTASASQHTMH